MDRLLVMEFVPAALLVNANLDILVFRGNIAPYVLPESGLASLNLAKMIQKELWSQVQTMIYRAKKENRHIKENAVRFNYSGEQRTINIHVAPLQVAQFEEPFFLLSFGDVSSATALLRQTLELSSTPGGREDIKDRQVRELREELDSTKQSYLRVVENQEATNEELKTTIEECSRKSGSLLSCG